jgi:hypothetical protein
MDPHGRVFYSVLAFVGLPMGCSLIWEVFVPDTPLIVRLGRAFLGLMFLFGALQSIERLFRPEKAQARSQSLSSQSARQWLDLSRRILMGSAAVGVMPVVVLRLAGGQHNKDLATDFNMVALMLSASASLLADICGESTAFPDPRVDFVTHSQ